MKRTKHETLSTNVPKITFSELTELEQEDYRELANHPAALFVRHGEMVFCTLGNWELTPSNSQEWDAIYPWCAESAFTFKYNADNTVTIGHLSQTHGHAKAA